MKSPQYRHSEQGLCTCGVPGQPVVEELKKTDRQGVIGRIKFDDGNQAIYGNDPAQTATGCVSQWVEGGKRVIVFPEAVADGKIKLPDWVKAAK